MLFHVSDRRRAITEFRDVLNPSGALYAVTNGLGHMREIDDLLEADRASEAGADTPEPLAWRQEPISSAHSSVKSRSAAMKTGSR